MGRRGKHFLIGQCFPVGKHLPIGKDQAPPAPEFILVINLIFLLIRASCKISEPLDIKVPTIAERISREENTVNIGHYVLPETPKGIIPRPPPPPLRYSISNSILLDLLVLNLEFHGKYSSFFSKYREDDI